MSPGRQKKISRQTPLSRLVRGRSDYARLRPSEREARQRAFDALREMRVHDLSLSAASRRAGTTPQTVRRYAGSSLRRSGGRYRATRSDRAYQRMAVLSTEGLVDVDVRGSAKRSLVARHWNAVRRFGGSGDVYELRRFAGQFVGGVELASDPDAVEEYLRRGEVDIDDIYVI